MHKAIVHGRYIQILDYAQMDHVGAREIQLRSAAHVHCAAHTLVIRKANALNRSLNAIVSVRYWLRFFPWGEQAAATLRHRI
jgi:hypothetical protein